MADKRFFKLLNDRETERLRFKIITLKGKVVDVVIQYETLFEGIWIPIVRYDCAHGYFHRDILNPDGSQKKLPIAIEDLETAISYAEQELKDRWESYKETYFKNKK